MPNKDEVMMEGVRLVFRNFAGKETPYNRKGDRNFAVVLPEEAVEGLVADGWNVKQMRARETDEEGEVPPHYLQVAVSYKGRPPRIVLVTSRGRTNLDEDLVDQLDWVEIENVDLIINPYKWEVNGKTGTKAYLKAIYVTITEDPLEAKYGALEDQQNPGANQAAEEPLEDDIPF